MSTNIANREEKVMDVMELESIKSQLMTLLDNNPKKMESFRTKILKMSLSYGLKECSPESIINAATNALALNLPLEAGQGYVVNYGGHACFDAGYKGWQVLAKRAGFSVQCDVVYSCDDFSQDGFGFNREMHFKPNFNERKGSDDKWAKENLTGVIVSILEDETGNQTHAFVDAEMIHKIVATSPGAGKKSKKTGQYHSPHDNWAEQMFAAKAIKQVLSKFPIDLHKSTQLNDAIQIINETESTAQEQFKAQQQPEYPQDRFDSMFPKWSERVKSGKNTAMSIITLVSNSNNLSENQLEKLYTLKNLEPIDAESE